MDQQSQGKKWYKRWYVIIPVAVIAVVIVSSLGGTQTPSTESTAINLGDEGYLRASGSEIVTILATSEAHEQFVTASIANDTYGMAKIVADGSGFNVSAGTKAKVIDSKFGIRKVRILDGEHAMREGWVAKEFIQLQ